MKKIIFIISVICIALSCKKKTTTAPPAIVSSLSVDGVAVNNPSHSSFINGSNYGVIAYGANSNPEIQITFFGSTAPASGTYVVTTGTVYNGECLFTLSDTSGTSNATGGSVSVTTSTTTPKNTATFSNISVGGNGGHHLVSGIITY